MDPLPRVIKRPSTQPVHVLQVNLVAKQRLARPDHHLPPRRIEPHHIERLAIRNAKATPLPDGEMHDTAM